MQLKSFLACVSLYGILLFVQSTVDNPPSSYQKVMEKEPVALVNPLAVLQDGHKYLDR